MRENGLESVFMTMRPTLQRFIAARGAGADADDLLQEMWVRVTAAQPGPIADPSAYLYRMADNLLLDRWRSDMRRRRRDDQWTEAIGGSRSDISEQPSPERVLLARERLQIVERMLADLGDRTAYIFRRYRIDGVSQRDIALTMGISLSAVEKHLQKAYRALVDISISTDADFATGRRRAIEGASDAAE
ncbi:RNA polymerase sigma-70 factor, ECF subfamily [Sphingomonas sp. YR710]|jgi:RNA polymerase sigma-70 factor (ECF subfamily)|nr:RNA polymerase sigma-70 factor, ECF subfamily [Sphingomonas sp. YR710]